MRFIKIGAVAVPINNFLKPHEYEYLFNDTRARVLLVSETLLSMVQQIPKDRLRFLREIVVAGESKQGHLSLADLMAAAAPELEPEPTSRDDAAFWLYSSGSTG